MSTPDTNESLQPAAPAAQNQNIANDTVSNGVVDGASNAPVVDAAQSAPAATASGKAAPATGKTLINLKCPSCGSKNTPESKFCRHCGIAIRLVASPIPAGKIAATKPAPKTETQSAPVVATGQHAAAPVAVAAAASATPVVHPATAPAPQNDANAAQAPVAAEPATSAASDSPENSTAEISPMEIDARRAHQLLDRALALSEKGDKAGAVLACRQSISLAPNAAAGYSMLGLLLERAGDVPHAITAYEKVLLLAPDSLLERDSLERLRAKARQSAVATAAGGGLFHFDEAELFSTPPEDDAAVQSTTEKPVVQTPVPVATVQQPLPAAALPGVVLGGSALATSEISSAAASRTALQNSAAMTVPPISPLPVQAAAPISFGEEIPPAPVAPRWLRAVRGERSFYMQSLPLLATATASLFFLLWARDVASSRIQPAAVIVPRIEGTSESSTGTEPGRVSQNGTTPASGTNAASPANDATFPVSNDRSAAAAAANAPATNGGANGAAPGNTRSATPDVDLTAENPPRSSPRVASMPRVIRPASPRSNSSRPSAPEPSPFGGLRPARVESPQPPAPEAPRALPQTGDGGGASSGGAPLNPSGSGTRGYFRVTTNRANTGAAPARPDSRARDAENDAREDARSGRTERAITRTTAAIEGGRDTGWRYQQRALLKLENGDNASAADDFQTAIAAYRDQIARGISTDEARAGISACQSGLRLAQARMR